MITETMKDLYADPKWKSQTGKDWGNGTCQQIWGPGTPLFYYREMAIDPAPEVHEAETYTYMPEKEPDGTIAAKKIWVIDFIAVHQCVVHHRRSPGCRFVPLVIIAGAVVDSELTDISHAHLESLRLQIAVYCGECLSCVGCGLHFAVDKVVKRHDKFLVVVGYCYSVIIFHVLMI